MGASHRRTRKRVSAAEKPDVVVAGAFAPIRNHPAVLALGEVSEFSDQPPLYALAGGVIASGLVMGDARTLRVGARMLAAHAAAIMLKNVFKRLIDRTRPDLIVEQNNYQLRAGKRFDHEYNSFPSGHSASAVAVARALSREYPEQATAALGVAGFMAATQVVRSTHYVSDVIAGAALGVLAEAATDAAFRRLPRR